jgi:hypothetical protein
MSDLSSSLAVSAPVAALPLRGDTSKPGKDDGAAPGPSPVAQLAIERTPPTVAAREAGSTAGPQERREPADAAVAVLITLVASAASVSIALTAGGLAHAVSSHFWGVVAFAAVTLALQLGTVPIYRRGAIGFAGVGLLAIGFVFGVGATMTTAMIAAAVNLARRRGKLHKALFDAGQLALASGAGTALYAAAGGSALAPGPRIVVSVLAGVAFFAVNAGLLSAVMAFSEGRSVLFVWKERFRWMFPYYAGSGFLALAAVVAHDKLGTIGLFAFALPPASMMLSTRQYLRRTEESVEQLREANDELEARAERIQKTHLATIGALARSMEAKDGYTGGHTERVSDVAAAIGAELGYEGDDLDGIRVGALLHDIGKIGIPERILHKPGPLDDEEWEVMREHPVISEFILAEVDLHPFVCQVARSSHERVDGMGYPDGKRGDEIPLPARIVLVADALDALTSDRPYRPGRPLDAALEELRAHSGTQFCPHVIAALEAVYRDRPHLLGDDPAAAVQLVDAA